VGFRTFATFVVNTTNTPQPLVGSWVTAGFPVGVPSPAPITLTLGTATTSGNDATNIFGTGPQIALLIDPAATSPATTLENVNITSSTGNTVTLGYKVGYGAGQPSGQGVVTEKVHTNGVFGTGSFIIPAQQANNVFVAREDGGTGTWFYIGNAFNMSATFRRIVKLANVSAGTMPFNYGATENYFGNWLEVDSLWCMGTANDQYSVSLAVV
jgi:hypothetical protein